MAKTIMKGADGIKAHIGQHLGYSDYLTVTQEMVNTFADRPAIISGFTSTSKKPRRARSARRLPTAISHCRSGPHYCPRSTALKVP